jgi:hypothetical protein
MHLAVIKDWKKNVAKEWDRVVGNRNVRAAVFVDLGLGDACLGFFEFADDTFEVGVGEAGRPYRQCYLGTDHGEASVKFVREVAGFLEED